YFFLIAVLFCAACEKQDAPDTNKPAPSTDPDQYGIPFAGVPDRRDATIYQVNIRSFSNSGNFQGVIARLDSIKALGTNVIYLMPIYQLGQLHAFNSPYCIKDYMEVNPEFGTLEDLRTLIENAHNKEMAVILDWVGNHTSWDHVWMSNTSWYAKNSSGEMYSPNGWNDVVQLNFGNQEMRKAMIKAMKYWILTANCDGFRCDYSDGPPVDFWKQAIDTLRNVKTHKLLLLAEGTRSGNFSAGFDYNFGFRFYDQLKKVFGNNQVSALTFDNMNSVEYSGTTEGQMTVRYITNHDVNSSDGTPQSLLGGNQGAMAAFVIAAYMKGIPMIYTGQEVGTPYSITFPFTAKNIDWSLNPQITAEYKKVLAFRNNSEAIRRGTLTSHSTADICAFTKTSVTETVFVAVNTRNSTKLITLPVSVANSEWKDAYTGATVNTATDLSLEPYQYLVIRK
ncbi:MAG TPA: alpha-amylase family glycosyl hydrolase, partial [Lentimicrobium sp.]|nr:alpha-amylase family glycosyl hydrolase [Lentimicrobium sp.]